MDKMRILDPKIYQTNKLCLSIDRLIREYTGSPQLPTTVGTSNSVAKQCDCKVKCEMTMLTYDVNYAVTSFSLPTEFACWKPAVKLTNSEHVTAEHSNGCNFED